MIMVIDVAMIIFKKYTPFFIKYNLNEQLSILFNLPFASLQCKKNIL